MTNINKSQVYTLCEQGLSQAEIARLLKTSRQRISQILSKKEKEQNACKERKEALKKEMFRLRGNGYSYQQIANELNVSYSWVGSVLREPFAGNRKKEQQVGRFMACCCCGSSWVETIKETPSTNCPACFSSCREIQKVYDQKTLETLEKYAQKIYLDES